MIKNNMHHDQFFATNISVKQLKIMKGRDNPKEHTRKHQKGHFDDSNIYFAYTLRDAYAACAINACTCAHTDDRRGHANLSRKRVQQCSNPQSKCSQISTSHVELQQPGRSCSEVKRSKFIAASRGGKIHRNKLSKK